MNEYFGCARLIVLTKMTGDGTGHIDMFCKLLDVDTALIGEVDPGDPQYEILEENAAYVASLIASSGEYYEVVRVTYTNSLIVNDKVIMPSYYSGSDLDADSRWGSDSRAQSAATGSRIRTCWSC